MNKNWQNMVLVLLFLQLLALIWIGFQMKEVISSASDAAVDLGVKIFSTNTGTSPGAARLDRAAGTEYSTSGILSARTDGGWLLYFPCGNQRGIKPLVRVV
jgi:hypothetical protein